MSRGPRRVYGSCVTRHQLLRRLTSALSAVWLPLLLFTAVLVILYKVPWGHFAWWPVIVDWGAAGPVSGWFAAFVTLGGLTFAIRELNEKTLQQRRDDALERHGLKIKVSSYLWQIDADHRWIVWVDASYLGPTFALVEEVSLHMQDVGPSNKLDEAKTMRLRHPLNKLRDAEVSQLRGPFDKLGEVEISRLGGRLLGKDTGSRSWVLIDTRPSTTTQSMEDLSVTVTWTAGRGEERYSSTLPCRRGTVT